MATDEHTGVRSIRLDGWAKLPLAMLVAMLGGVGAIVWTARGRLGDIEHEQRATRSLVNDLPKREELRDLERRVTSALRLQMKHAILKCPRRAVRADAWMDCKVVFPEEPPP